jgi:hypothetical protein
MISIFGLGGRFASSQSLPYFSRSRLRAASTNRKMRRPLASASHDNSGCHRLRGRGRVRSVLAESNESGHSEHFTPVRFERAVEPGCIVEARIIGHDGSKLIASP